MGIDSTSSNGGNSIDRLSSLKAATYKPKNKSNLNADDKPVVKQSIADFKYPSVAKEDRAQIEKSVNDIANLRGSDELNIAWSSQGASPEQDTVSINKPAISVLEKLESISEDAIERSDTYEILFKTQQGVEN